MIKHDIAIIGGGPGGSTLAALLCKKGFNVGLFEKETFPRFRIGESLLPCSMDIFRESGVFEHLNSGKYIQKFGAQFIDHRTNESILFNFGVNNIPSQAMAFEVPRAEFDKDLLAHAKKMGATIYQPERVDEIIEGTDSVVIRTNEREVEARYVADASGRIAFLGNKKKMRQPNLDLINNIGVFAHYKGVKRETGVRGGDIIIGVLPNQAWSWTIPFQGDVTSVGVVTNTKFITNQNENFEGFIEKAIENCPVFQERMNGATRVSEIQAISNYSHTCEAMVGPRWIQIGDAAAFLDPIFSSGVHVSVSCAKMASEVFTKAFEGNLELNRADLGGQYETTVRKGVKRFHHLIRMFYDTDFIKDMKKLLTLKHSCGAFTAAVAGDVWNDDNVVFKMGAL